MEKRTHRLPIAAIAIAIVIARACESMTGVRGGVHTSCSGSMIADNLSDEWLAVRDYVMDIPGATLDLAHHAPARIKAWGRVRGRVWVSSE